MGSFFWGGERKRVQVLNSKSSVLLLFSFMYQRLVGASPTEILDPFNGLSVEVQASSPTLLLELCLMRPCKHQEKTAETFHRLAKLGTSGSFHGFRILDPEGMQDNDPSLQALPTQALGLQKLKDKTEDIVQAKAVFQDAFNDTKGGKILWVGSGTFARINCPAREVSVFLCLCLFVLLYDKL